MASNDTENHVEPAMSEEEKAKTKMSARYNLFRYKSKDISSMTYNGEFSIFFDSIINLFILPSLRHNQI